VAEGAQSLEDVSAALKAERKKGNRGPKNKAGNPGADAALSGMGRGGNTLSLARQLEILTGLESRVTILGYLQRGGTPSANDRILSTRLGTACTKLINEGTCGVMLAARGDEAVPVPLEEIVGKIKTVPRDHSWIESARRVGTSFGD
jgi:6-phosphofructokinase 1